jgi:hypothetical protein
MAKGGKGGTAGTGNSASCPVRIYGAGGAGGQAASGFGTIKFSGGNGGTPTTSGTNAGGASSAGISYNGTNGSNNQLGGIAPTGGGDGGLGGETTAYPGCSPGGGSGGADNSNPSALGGNGQIILKYKTASCPTGIEIMYGGPQSVAMTSTSWKTICSGTSINLPLTATTAAKFTWIAANNVNTTGESITTQTVTTISNVLTNTTTTNQTVTYTVTPTLTSNPNCTSPGIPQILSVVVLAKPMMTSINTTTICSGSTLNIPLTSNVAANYTWIAANNANTAGESTTLQNTSIINDVIINNSTTTTQTVTYTITPIPTSGVCAATAQTQIISVSVIPSLVLTVTPSTPFLFNGTVQLTATVGGGLPAYAYEWKNNLNTVVGTNATYVATAAGTYIVAITDQFNVMSCNTFKVVTVSLSPLPIELLFFNAVYNGKAVDVTWKTASETNNEYFTVERSEDMINFVAVTSNIPSKAVGGNSTAPIYYCFNDNKAEPGINYYRLKQTDYNGEIKYSKNVAVEITGNSFFTFNIAPNPCDGTEFSSFITADKNKEILIVVYDVLGQEKYSKVIVTEQKGNMIYVMDLSQRLDTGVYMITATSNQKNYSKKLVVK